MFCPMQFNVKHSYHPLNILEIVVDLLERVIREETVVVIEGVKEVVGKECVGQYNQLGMGRRSSIFREASHTCLRYRYGKVVQNGRHGFCKKQAIT